MRALMIAACLLLAASAARADSPVRFKVLADEAGEIHRTVEVRLERRHDETDLRQIAATVKGREPREYRRTLVNFYLPGMELGQGAWATATLVKKDAVVRIAGLTLQEEAAFIAEAGVDSRALLGSWLTSTPAAPGRLTIYRDGKQLYAEWKLRNGVRTVDELAERKDAGGRRFDMVPATVEHFVLVASGDLELRHGERRIALAQRIDPAAAKAAVAEARPRVAAPATIAAAAAPLPKPERVRAAIAAPIDTDTPLKLTPRPAVAAEVEAAEPRIVAVPAPPATRETAAGDEPRKPKRAEPARSEPVPERKPAATRSRPPVKSASAAPSGGNTAQERLIKQIFRNPY